MEKKEDIKSLAFILGGVEMTKSLLKVFKVSNYY
jgi:hypothetical protein